MRKKMVVAMLMGMGIATSAHAAEWWNVGVGGYTPNRVISFVDKDSIKQMPNGHARAWVQLVNENATEHHFSRSLIEYDCPEQRRSFVASTIYRRDGTNESVPGSGSWDYTVPDTIGESEAQFVCAGGVLANAMKIDDPVTSADGFYASERRKSPVQPAQARKKP